MYIDKNGEKHYPTKEVNTAWYYIQDIHRSNFTPWWSILRIKNGGSI